MPRIRALRLTGRAVFPLAAIALSACASMSSPTASTPAGPTGYAVGSTPQEIVRSGNNECVHSDQWNPKLAIEQCEPQLVARAAPPPPPEPAAAAEPAPTPSETGQAPATAGAAGEPLGPPNAEEQTAVVAPPAAEAPAPIPQEVYVGADTHFGFDQATLDDEAKRGLDKVAENARQAQDAKISIVGYADRIGSPEYNQDLSQRRADAVRAYLIDQGVPEAAITMDARGETDPIVRCENRQGNQLIDCLEPNRRSEVMFSGMESPER